MQYSSVNTLKLELTFPLEDGRTLVQGPLAYNQDGLATQHNSDFMRDQRFIDAYRIGMENGKLTTHIEWRVHIALWCATQALALEGDYVECGVHTGILSASIMEWLNFSQFSNRRFFLFDTWAGIPVEQMSQSEKIRLNKMNQKYANGDALYDAAQKKFSRWPNANLIRGKVPDSLVALKDVEQITYLSIDLNVAEGEIKAIEYLWPRVVRGGFVLLDDYGWAPHINQKIAWDFWARKHGVMICCLPTGQGLIIKS